MKWSKAKKIINKNPEVKKELKKNKTEYELISEIIKSRQEKKLTQSKLAELSGTKQSNVSRLESGEYNPTLSFLEKIAHAMDKELQIHLEEIGDGSPNIH